MGVASDASYSIYTIVLYLIFNKLLYLTLWEGLILQAQFFYSRQNYIIIIMKF